MAANKEIRILKTNTLEEFRQKSNDIALHLGDNEQLSTDLADKVLTYTDVSADANVFLTPRFEYKNGESVDNISGYIILQDVSSITGFADGGTISQSGGYSATIVHATTEKILVTNSSGTFNSTEDLSDGSNTIANANVIRLVTEAYPKGLLRVYKNNVEIDQGLDANEFHVVNLAGKIALTGSPDVSDILEGTVLNQTGGFQGTVLRARSNELLFKAISGTFQTGQVLKFTTTQEGGTVGGTAVAIANYSGSFITYDTAYGNAIEINTPAAANDDIKIFSANLVDALNELQHDIGSVESLTTSAGSLQGAINELDAELGTITTGAMGTAASTVSGAIAEHETQLGNIDFTGISSTVSGSLTTLHGEIGDISTLESSLGTNLVSALNNIEAVFDASQNEISAGSNAFAINSGAFTINSSGDIVLDADGADVLLKDNGTNYGSLTNSSSNLVIKSGTTTMLTGSGANATFANNVTVTNDLIVNNNVDIEGNVDVNGSIETDGLSINGTTLTATVAELNILDGATLDVNELNLLDGVTASTSEINLLDGVTATTNELNILDGVTASAADINLIDGITNGTVIASKAIITDSNKDISGGRNITISGELESGSLDVNGVADISGNLTIGSLNTSSQHVRGSINELHTELGDIAALNSTFANDSNLVAALNELQTEVGANTYPAGGPASGLGNVTAAINAINSDIGTTSYSALSSTISGGLAQLHTEVGNLSLNTSATNLTSAINELHTEINTNASNISSNDTDISNINTNIGSLGSLTTSVNTNLVAAINSVEDEVDTLQTNQGTIGSLATTASNLVAAVNELHGEINTNTSNISSNDSDISTLQSGKLNKTDAGTQVLSTNLTFGTSGKTMTFASGTTLDLSAATLTLGGGGGTLNFNTAFVELDVDANQQGLKVNRESITGVSAGAPDAQLRWNEGNDKDVGWEVVYPNGADNAGLTTSLVTFDNAGDLVDGSTETGINVTFGSNNFNFAVQVDDSTIEVNGSNQLQVKNSGIISDKIASSAVTSAKIASSAVTNTKIANATIANTKLVNSSITVSDGSNTSAIDLGSTLTFSGTSNEIEVLENAGTITIGLPNNVTIAGDLTVQGTTTSLQTTDLEITDKNILLGKGSTTSSANDGTGITFGEYGAAATFNYSHTGTKLVSNKDIEATRFLGPLTGNVTGNVTGNLTGNVTGNVSGSSGSCTGNAATATALATSRDFSITGDITANAVGFTGAGNVVLNATIDANTVDVAELNISGTPTLGKAITYSSGGGLEWSTISFTDTNTTYGISTVDSGDNAIIRLTAGGSGSGTDDITLAAGSNITITESGDTITIASTDTNTIPNNSTLTIGAAAGLSGGGSFTTNQSSGSTVNLALDLTELPLETADIVGTDHLVYIDGGTQKKIAFSNVNLSAFDNTASGFTTNTGTVSSLSDLSITATAAEINKLDGYTGGVTELNYLDSLHATGVTSTEFDYLDGVTSNIQTQLDGKLTSSSSLNATNITTGTLASARLPDLAVSDFGGAAIQTSLETFSDSDSVLMTAAAIEDRITGKGYTTNTGDITQVNITAGTGLTGSVNTASGNHTQTIALDHLGIEDLVDPNADRIMFWDDSAGSVKFLTAGSNLTISGTTISATDTNDNTITSIRQNNTGTYRTGNINLVNGSNIAITESSAGVFNFAVTGITSDTGTPAILSNGTLNRTASTIRSDIGAGTMSSFTITDGVSTNEVIENGDSFNLLDSSFIDLRLSGSVGSRSIQASLNSSFGAFKNVAVTNSSNVIISTLTADSASDTLNIKEGSNITFSGDAGTDTFTISSTNTTYSAGNGISLSGTTFSVSAGSGLIQTAGGLTLESDQRGTIQSIGYDSSNTIHTDNGYISFRTNAADRFKMESDGDFHATGDLVAYSTTPSDERLKENIQVVNGALEKVSQLKGVTFNWKKDGKHSAGLIAQDVEKVLPSAVKEKELSLTHDDGEKYKVIENSQITSLLVEAIKELKEQNIELKAELEKLKSINSNS